MKLIDSHTHVQFAAFKKDYKEVIKRAQENGIGMINVGTQKNTSKRAVELANEFENVWATVGLHPTEKSEDFDYEYYKKLASDSKVVAIGECGFDYYRITNNELGIKNKQREIFIKQIQLAQELQKALMIHCRPSKNTENAYGDLLSIIHNSKFIIPKIAHFYAGSLETARKLLDEGCYFTFGGVITFSRSYDEIIKYLPLEKIMVETDAPYVAPEPHRGQRNEPAYVIEVAKKLAEIKNVSFEKIAEITTRNCLKIFSL